MADIISTERLVLRTWTESDRAPFIAMNTDSEVMKYFPKLITADETNEMIGRIKKHFDINGFGLYAVEQKETGEFIGYTGFAVPTFESFFTPCIEIGWRYKKEVWGMGFATEAARACLQYGFDALKFGAVFSFTSMLNERSERVMQRIGMKNIGVFDHPKIKTSNELCKHILYKIEKAEFTGITI